MCHQPSHLLITSHSSASRYCVVQQWRALCLVCAAAFALGFLLSLCNQNAFFSIPFLFTKMPAIKHCAIALFLLITSPLALTLQQIFLRQIATNTHLPSSSQKPYHIFIITPHLAHPLCKKIFATTPSSGTPHTHIAAATAPCCHTHIMSTMGAMQFARFVQQPFCSLACRIIFLQKTLSAWLRKSNLLTLQDQSHASAKLNALSPSFNPAPLSKTHHSPLAERVVVAIQTKCIYYSTAALAYYPHMR